MSKLLHLIEVLLIPLIAMISMVVSLGDLFDIFHLVSTSRLPMLILLIMSMALGSLSFIQSKCNEMQREIESLSSKMDLERMSKLLGQIDPDLRKVLNDDYFLSKLGFLQTAVVESKVHLNEVAHFRFYFQQTLHCYPKATFFLTSSIATSYLWKDTDIENAFIHFIRGGGKVKQIFFVKSSEECNSPDVQAILEHQRDIDIEINVINSTSIPGDLKKYFLVESERRLAWELSVDEEGHLREGVVIANKQIAADYCKVFERLLSNTQPLYNEPCPIKPRSLRVE